MDKLLSRPRKSNGCFCVDSLAFLLCFFFIAAHVLAEAHAMIPSAKAREKKQGERERERERERKR